MRADEKALDLLFREARSFSYWVEKPVEREVLVELYHLAKWGPTSMNGFPMRVVFVCSADAKAELAEMAAEGNKAKILAAPVCAIIAHDNAFHEKLPALMPHAKGAGAGFAKNEALAHETAFRNGTLQGAYFMMAARALGLDCGPMSGFDKGAVDKAFFAGSNLEANFLCNIGYGNREKLNPRLPRLPIEEACRFV